MTRRDLTARLQSAIDTGDLPSPGPSYAEVRDTFLDLVRWAGEQLADVPTTKVTGDADDPRTGWVFHGFLVGYALTTGGKLITTDGATVNPLHAATGDRDLTAFEDDLLSEVFTLVSQPEPEPEPAAAPARRRLLAWLGSRG